MARFIYSDSSGIPQDPVDITELQQLLNTGVLTTRSHIAQEGGGEWVRITSVLSIPDVSGTSSNLAPPIAKNYPAINASASEVVLASQADTKSQNTTDDLLRLMIGIQERQLYWVRMTAIVVFGSVFLVLLFGFAFRVRFRVQ